MNKETCEHGLPFGTGECSQCEAEAESEVKAMKDHFEKKMVTFLLGKACQKTLECPCHTIHGTRMTQEDGKSLKWHYGCDCVLVDDDGLAKIAEMGRAGGLAGQVLQQQMRSDMEGDNGNKQKPKGKVRICHLHGQACDESLPVLNIEVAFDKIVDGKQQIEKRRRFICARCAGALSAEFFKLLRTMPELGPMCGMEVQKQSKIVTPNDILRGGRPPGGIIR